LSGASTAGALAGDGFDQGAGVVDGDGVLVEDDGDQFAA
jgi:hypothetical protein